MDIGKSPSLRLPGATAWRMNWSVPDQIQKGTRNISPRGSGGAISELQVRILMFLSGLTPDSHGFSLAGIGAICL